MSCSPVPVPGSCQHQGCAHETHQAAVRQHPGWAATERASGSNSVMCTCSCMPLLEQWAGRMCVCLAGQAGCCWAAGRAGPGQCPRAATGYTRGVWSTFDPIQAAPLCWCRQLMPGWQANNTHTHMMQTHNLSMQSTGCHYYCVGHTCHKCCQHQP